MAVAPKFAGQKLAAGLSPLTVHTLELCRLFGRQRGNLEFELTAARSGLCLSSTISMLRLKKYCSNDALQFSKKLFSTVYTSVKPLVEQKYKSKVQIVFRQQVQPWHPSSTLVHEAGVAVLQTNPEKFWVRQASMAARPVTDFEHAGLLEGAVRQADGIL